MLTQFQLVVLIPFVTVALVVVCVMLPVRVSGRPKKKGARLVRVRPQTVVAYTWCICETRAQVVRNIWRGTAPAPSVAALGHNQKSSA